MTHAGRRRDPQRLRTEHNSQHCSQLSLLTGLHDDAESTSDDDNDNDVGGGSPSHPNRRRYHYLSTGWQRGDRCMSDVNDYADGITQLDNASDGDDEDDDLEKDGSTGIMNRIVNGIKSCSGGGAMPAVRTSVQLPSKIDADSDSDSDVGESVDSPRNIIKTVWPQFNALVSERHQKELRRVKAPPVSFRLSFRRRRHILASFSLLVRHSIYKCHRFH
jgi:hypothetical protein